LLRFNKKLFGGESFNGLKLFCFKPFSKKKILLRIAIGCVSEIFFSCDKQDEEFINLL
jgi:hypothetical protein